MAQLTWRNVDAPNFSGAADGFRTFSNLISNAGKSASDAIGAYDKTTSDGVNQSILASMMRYQDPIAMQTALRENSLLEGVDPRRISADTLTAMNNQVGHLTGQASDLYKHNRTVDGDTRMDGAAPAIFSYASAAQSGDQAALQRAWNQNEESLRGLRSDQILDLATKGGAMVGTGIGNRTSQFNLGVNQRNDVDQQSAAAVLNKVSLGIWGANDVYSVLRNSKEYDALSESGKRLVQNGLTGMGYQFQGPSAGAGMGASPSSIGSGSPATAAIGGAVGAGGIDVNRAFGALRYTESNNQQFDKNGNPLTSPKGATGVTQVMPTTGPEAAKLAGLPWNPELFSRKKTGDVAKDKEAVDYSDALGMAYFSKQLKDFDGNLAHAYAAYNAGPAVTKDYRDGTNTSGKNPRLTKTPDGIPPFKETQDYVKKNMSKYGSGDPTAQARPPTNIATNGKDSLNELQLRTAQNNAGGTDNVFAAMADTKSTPVSIAAKWADEKKFVGANQGAIVDIINDMVKKYGKHGVNPSAAAAILEGGGLTGATDWTQRLITNRFRAMGEWVLNEDYIKQQVDAIKDGKTLTNASANQGTETASAMLKSYLEKQTAAREALRAVTAAAAAGRPELNAEAVPRAQRELASIDEMIQRLSKNQQETSNLQPVLDKPQPADTSSQSDSTGITGLNAAAMLTPAGVLSQLIGRSINGKPAPASTDGKATSAIAAATTVADKPTITAPQPSSPNPARNLWQEQQKAAVESRVKNQAEKAAKRAAEEAAKAERVRRMQQNQQEYFAKTGKILLIPPEN